MSCWERAGVCRVGVCHVGGGGGEEDICSGYVIWSMTLSL